MDEERSDEGVTAGPPEGEEDVSGTTDEVAGESEAGEDGSADEAPPGVDAQRSVREDDDAAEEESPSGSPGVPPPAGDDRRSPEGLPITTTTGDPSKDFRGPSVTEEARDGMGDDPALDEPGYGDLGHAEDRDVLRDD